MRQLSIEPLEKDNYAPFGAVIAAPTHGGKPANQGTARRHDWLGPVRRLRDQADWNLCVFRCAPRDLSNFVIRLLEHHPKSTQVFVPMNATRYLVVVAEAASANAPNPETLRAFMATGRQGISYHPGIWHHPLLALDHETDFACLVSEDGSADDCTTWEFPESALRVIGPLSSQP
ncbi:MAG: ureidoglycolate lyase [Polyangiaceae bacterium]